MMVLQSRRKLFFYAVTSLLALAVGLVGAEIVLRLFPQFMPLEPLYYLRADKESMGVRQPYIGYLQRPLRRGVIPTPDFSVPHRTDGYGFRNPWPWPERADIVVVGDSLGFGYGVLEGESWPGVLRKALHQREVINLSLIGAGPEQYARVYEVYGQRLRPRLLVVAIFPGNDFWDARMFARWERSGRGENYMVWRTYGTVRSGWNHPVTTTKELMKERSYLYNLLRQARTDVQRKRQQEPRRLIYEGQEVYLSPSDFERLTDGSEPGRREFGLVVGAMERIIDMCRQEGTRVLFVLQPSKEEVYLPLTGEKTIDPSAGLRDWLDEREVPFLDLAPAFRERARAGELLFFPSDGHPNVKGYALIAEQLEPEVRRLLGGDRRTDAKGP